MAPPWHLGRRLAHGATCASPPWVAQQAPAPGGRPGSRSTSCPAQAHGAGRGGAPAAKGRLAETGPEPEGFRDGVASGAAPPGTVHALVSWSLQADASTVRSPGSGDGGHGGPAGDSSS